jgi:hypothetical protein
MIFKKIERAMDMALKKDYKITFHTTKLWIYNEYSVTISMNIGNKDFLKINRKNIKSDKINEEMMKIILYTMFLELYRKYSDALFTMEFKVDYDSKMQLGVYECCRTRKIKNFDKEDLSIAIKDMICLTELNNLMS